MLERLLRILAQGGVHSRGELAQALGVSESLLEQGIQHLVRLGYLQASGDDCRGMCSGCDVAGICAVGGGDQVWTLTEKGSQTAGKLR
jgi:predicted ArsR family transcriptional regulator